MELKNFLDSSKEVDSRGEVVRNKMNPHLDLRDLCESSPETPTWAQPPDPLKTSVHKLPDVKSSYKPLALPHPLNQCYNS